MSLNAVKKLNLSNNNKIRAKDKKKLLSLNNNCMSKKLTANNKKKPSLN